MHDTDTPSPVSASDLRRIKAYIAARAPLVAEGRKVVIDERAVDELLPKALHKIFGAADLTPEKIGQLKENLMQQFNKAAADLPFDAAELENETDAPKRTLLMAAPTKAPMYELHERMAIFRAWYSIRHALVKAGAHLEMISISPETGGNREAFTRDRYVMINGTAYLPDTQMVGRFGALDEKDYKGEVLQVQKALQDRGVNTVIVKDAWFEGGNVTRHFGSRTIFVGMDGEWSSEASAQKLLDAINANEEKPWSLLTVPLTNYFEMYHTDTGMSEELPHGEIMLSDRLTDKATYEKIRSIVGPENIIDLTRDEASELATNFIDVGDTLVLTGQCDSLKTKLAAKGYTVVSPGDYNEPTFEMGGGGVHCLTNDVPKKHRCPRKPASPAP